MDIWSLGAIYSEVAVWSLQGPEGLNQYRAARQAKIKALPEWNDADDCFHDGKDVLDTVEWQHRMLSEEVTGELGERKLMRSLTSRVVDVVIEQMLLADSSSRTAAKDLHPQAERLLNKARRAAQAQTTFGGEHTTAAEPASPSAPVEMSQYLPDEHKQLYGSPRESLQSFSTANGMIEHRTQRGFLNRSHLQQHDRGDLGVPDFSTNSDRGHPRTHGRTLSDQELSAAVEQAFKIANASPEPAANRQSDQTGRQFLGGTNGDDTISTVFGDAGPATPQGSPQTRKAARAGTGSKAHDVPKLTVEELQIWYDAKKLDRPVQLREAEWLFRDLEKRDHVSSKAFLQKAHADSSGFLRG
jgi:hypothetical protein